MEVHGVLTSEDIAKGQRRNSTKCPVALCLRPLFPANIVSVSKVVRILSRLPQHMIENYNPDYEERERQWGEVTLLWGTLPESMLTFIRNFDAGYPVKPT